MYAVLKFLQQHNLLQQKKINTLALMLENIKRWKVKPALNHSDLRLKNVIADEAGNIQAIIGWENCSSNAAPYWDLSIALHDLSIKGKQKFLEGYTPDIKEINRNGYALTVFNLINLFPYLQQMMRRTNEYAGPLPADT